MVMSMSQLKGKKAEVPGRIAHDFRRTAVRNLVRAGVRSMVVRAGLLLVLYLLLTMPSTTGATTGGSFDLVLSGGRVMDPESGLDEVRDVGIRDGKVVALSETALSGREVLDVRGLVVAPGFIDLHAHGQDNLSNSFQARDGVTAALDLEFGSYPVADLYAKREGRAILHYGVSIGHIPARIKMKTGLNVGHYPTREVYAAWYERWLGKVLLWFLDPQASLREPASEAEIAQVVSAVSQGLDEGGLGIGLGLDYVPGASDQEIQQLFELAAARSVPCFVHMKGVASPTDMSAMETVLGHVGVTGASLHLHHITSMGQQRTPRYLEMIEAARAKGWDVTVEAYPYTAASTYIESAFFDEGWRKRLGIGYADLHWCETGERLTEESFQKYRKQGGTVIIHMMETEIVDTAIAHPLVMIASDGLPMLKGGEHPRGAGTYARVLGHYSRERGLMGLMEALRKMTLMPAQRLESLVPAMKHKGRIRAGADADITAFDPAQVIDTATFKDSHQPSSGILHVLVAGKFVVQDGELVKGIYPGQPIRARVTGENIPH